MTHASTLDRKLEQYATTAKAQVTPSRSVTEMAGFAAAAGATLAMAGTADAAIIYSGVQNISVGINPAAVATTSTFTAFSSVGIDIDGGGTDFYAVNALLAAVNSTNPTSSFKYLGVAVGGATGGAALLGSSNTLGAANLASGAVIGPAGAFSASSAGAGRYASMTTASSTDVTFGNLAPSAIGFVGIQLASGNFGWIRLHVAELGLNQPFAPFGGPFPLFDGQDIPDRLTIIDWAYSDDGLAIRAGEGASVPEPSALGLLALGAVGIAALRRRRKEIRQVD